ncbi:MAG: glutaredoxin 2 [Bdellovibrionota bacterium]
MKPTLYHYSHCPFCVRVRMAAGFLKINYDTKLLRYDDEQTPIRLAGSKMLPIWVNENGNAINESLDIISLIDIKNKFDTKKTMFTQEWKSFEERVNELSGYVHNLAMPYFIYTKEFDDKSKIYFQKKKEQKRGPFEVLIKNRNLFEKELQECLVSLEKDIAEYYKSKSLTLHDVILASHLWGMYVVPEFQFSPKLHSYLQRVKKECNFEYQEDLWK